MKNALIIGIDKYQFRPLRGCINDAERIANILSSPQYGYSVSTLLNDQATRANIKGNIVQSLQNSSEFILFFAGHGQRTPFGTYLLSIDTAPHDEGIDLNWLSNAIRTTGNDTKSITLIIDACHSGDGDVRAAEEFEPEINIEDLRCISTHGIGRVLLAACKGKETAKELNLNGAIHGAFTHYLCCAMEGHAADSNGNVTINAAYDYVASMLRNEGRQTPVMRGDQEGQIIIGSNVKKIGSWEPDPQSQNSLQATLLHGAELLHQAQSVCTSSSSYADWQNIGYATAARAFEPILSWFRRRLDSNIKYIENEEFKKQFQTCSHLLKQLCSLTPNLNIGSGELTTNIGGGSFGNVWKVTGGPWSTPVCFKAYHPHELMDQQKESRFRRGFQAMRQLDHPNIVKVRQLSEVPFGFFMDFIQGANLRQLNPGASLEPEVIVGLLLEVAETLQHAHKKGVIHRDVKPENIVVAISDDGQYSAHLTDFDLAWFSAATQLTKFADGFGSHFYAAPEQINSPQSNAAHRTTVDVYAFGQLCFFCICGRDPMAFDRDSNTRALAEQLGRKWNDARASAAMQALFQECTENQANKRIQDFRLICEKLAQLQILLRTPENSLSSERFIEQLAYTMTGDLFNAKGNISASIRSRSNRTGVDITINKDAEKTCAVEVYFHPDSLLLEGKRAPDVRSLINARIDEMLNEYKRSHDAARRGAKVGAFQMSIFIDKLPKSNDGVLAARSIISKTIDILEQA